MIIHCGLFLVMMQLNECIFQTQMRIIRETNRARNFSFIFIYFFYISYGKWVFSFNDSFLHNRSRFYDVIVTLNRYFWKYVRTLVKNWVRNRKESKNFSFGFDKMSPLGRMTSVFANVGQIFSYSCLCFSFGESEAKRVCENIFTNAELLATSALIFSKEEKEFLG